jgi:hypothetical protein
LTNISKNSPKISPKNAIPQIAPQKSANFPVLGKFPQKWEPCIYQSRLVLVLYSEYSEDFPITNSVDNSRQAVGISYISESYNSRHLYTRFRKYWPWSSFSWLTFRLYSQSEILSRRVYILYARIYTMCKIWIETLYPGL